ncbi:MAG: P1 family peptidase [Lactobacillus sp.]|jgi:D-aminopeptidase|nr:P1 family peptidase [Lactobacillus sp.]
MGVENKWHFNLQRRYRTGKLNKITDVPGVKVGHLTLQQGDDNTGVTAIIPAPGNLFKQKLLAGDKVLNGFGKTAGLVQVDELGTLETPILMTNTFAVGTCLNALIDYSLKDNPDIGLTTGTVNPVVMECNDGDLNDIRARHVTEANALSALAAAQTADPNFAEGGVGAGTGMTCMGFKGGIGSASRTVEIAGKTYHLGCLLNSNFGFFGNLRAGDFLIGEALRNAVLDRAKQEHNPKYTRYLPDKDKGSVVMVIATDAPLSSRQLRRLSTRTSMGLARTGSYSGDGSGDIAVAFSTANRIDHNAQSAYQVEVLPDSLLDDLFQATVETVEESVLSSLVHAKTTTGIRDNTFYSLADFLQ